MPRLYPRWWSEPHGTDNWQTQRNDIGVFLSNNEDLEGGATATVQVPGQYVYQLTSEGPKPMPDMPRPDQRDSVTDTGSHLGLAAAFAQGGLPQNNGADPSGTAAVEAREPASAGATAQAGDDEETQA